MEIKKWHLYLADLNPRVGTEPGKVRPVVVVQTDILNGIHPSTIICPITTNIITGSKYLRVHLEKGEAVLERRSDILVDQIRSIDNHRFIEMLGKLNKENQKLLQENINIVLN